MSDPDIYQVEDNVPYRAGWKQTNICCDCLLTHQERYSIRTNPKTGKRELWCVTTRDPVMTKKLRRQKKRKER